MGLPWINWVSPAYIFAVCVTNFHFLKNMGLYIGEKFFLSETPRGRWGGGGVVKKMECPILFSAPPPNFLLRSAASEYGSTSEALKSFSFTPKQFHIFFTLPLKRSLNVYNLPLKIPIGPQPGGNRYFMQ